MGSIQQALNRTWAEGFCTAYTDGTYVGDASSVSQQRRIARSLGFPRRGAAFYSVMARTGGQVAEALAEQERRLP